MDGPRSLIHCRYRALLRRGTRVFALSLAWPALAAAQSSPPVERIVVASVDVSLTHRLTDAAGAPAGGPVTHTAFTLQKVRGASGKALVVLTYRPTSPAAATRATATPLDGGRIEYDIEAKTTTVFDEGGRRPNPRLSPGGNGPNGLGSTAGWLDSLIIARDEAADRREALERTHGRPAGRLGRLARYVRTDGDVWEEVLADPEWAVPIETTRRRNGTLEAHTRIEYGTTAEGHRIRRRVTSEQSLDGGRRSVLAMEFTNVVTGGRRP